MKTLKRFLTKLTGPGSAPAQPGTAAVSAATADHDLRATIAELEAQIAEHETTNAFLRDLLTEKWFDGDADELVGERSLQQL